MSSKVLDQNERTTYLRADTNPISEEQHILAPHRPTHTDRWTNRNSQNR